MKNLIINMIVIAAPVILGVIPPACTVDLLEREATTELDAAVFWKTEADATTALYGAYASVRPLFDRDCFFDGHGEFIYVRGVTAGPAIPGESGYFRPQPGYGMGGFNIYFQQGYGAIHRANYVIDNVSEMLKTASASSRPALEAIVGEARLLRGIVYFRLISLWGDIPYIGTTVKDAFEVDQITRTPIRQVKDSIMTDFTYAYEKLPADPPGFGRVGKPAALSFRGKMQLYWACWNKFGWPELDGFVPDETEAINAYKGAAADFKHVIDDYGLTLFRNGEPGDWGTMGSAEVLPNYFYLFIPKTGNGDPENIMAFTHGGIGTGQGEELMRIFGGGTMEGGQGRIWPTFALANRYQSTVTGDFCEPLIPMNPSAPGARTAENSALNPQSYTNRDYRMKASILWDYEMIMGLQNLQETGYAPFIFQNWAGEVVIDGVKYITYYQGGAHGYIFRKFLRNYAGAGRSEGDYAWPVIRLADVYLMYAEASNEAYGPQNEAIELVNKVRHRGNLPPLATSKTATKEAFFAAIEQERVVELVAEGHRGFDLRRWRALTRVWGSPYGDGVKYFDTHRNQQQIYFQNVSERGYEQCYIFAIPESERDRNPNLTQNRPWM